MPFYKSSCFALFLLPVYSYATDTLTVQQCRDVAVQHSPLQVKKLYAESIRALQISNLHSNDLPHLAIGAQATWQSDVFGLPIESPLFRIPPVPKDQYKLSVDVSQRIYDGGSDRYLRQQRDLESDLLAAQVDVDVFSLRETVTNLYFNILLLQESETVWVSAKEDLQRRWQQAEAAITEGVALRTTADQIRIQILKTEQQLAASRADQLSLKKVLATWLSRENIDFALQPPPPNLPVNVATLGNTRPEYRLLDLQRRNLQLGKDALALKTQPHVDAFLQSGLGRPNPFNFFETGFQPFLLVGLRIAWMPFDWGNRHRDAQVFDLQAKSLDSQRLLLDQRLAAGTIKDQEDAAKYRAQLELDDRILVLQADIVQRADAQVKNGIMTATDYLTQLNTLTQAQLTKRSHLVQVWQAQELERAKWE